MTIFVKATAGDGTEIHLCVAQQQEACLQRQVNNTRMEGFQLPLAEFSDAMSESDAPDPESEQLTTSHSSGSA